MKLLFFIVCHSLIIAFCYPQSSVSSLILFQGRPIGFANAVTVVKIDTSNRRVMFGEFLYLLPIDEYRQHGKYEFDSLPSLSRLLDTVNYDTFIYSNGKIYLNNRQFAYYKNSKLCKISKITHPFNEDYEEEIFCEVKDVDIYFFLIPFDLYDFKKNRFRKIGNNKKEKWRILQNLTRYDHFGYRYQFINQTLPFFSPYSFVGERENRFRNYFELGNFYESYRYMEKLMK